MRRRQNPMLVATRSNDLVERPRCPDMNRLKIALEMCESLAIAACVLASRTIAALRISLGVLTNCIV